MILELDLGGGYYVGPYWSEHSIAPAHKICCARCTARIAMPCRFFSTVRAWALCPRCMLLVISRNRQKFDAMEPAVLQMLVTGLTSLVKRRYRLQLAENN